MLRFASVCLVVTVPVPMSASQSNAYAPSASSSMVSKSSWLQSGPFSAYGELAGLGLPTVGGESLGTRRRLLYLLMPFAPTVCEGLPVLLSAVTSLGSRSSSSSSVDSAISLTWPSARSASVDELLLMWGVRSWVRIVC